MLEAETKRSTLARHLKGITLTNDNIAPYDGLLEDPK